jgi:hypothetical protein
MGRPVAEAESFVPRHRPAASRNRLDDVGRERHTPGTRNLGLKPFRGGRE